MGEQVAAEHWGSTVTGTCGEVSIDKEARGAHSGGAREPAARRLRRENRSAAAGSETNCCVSLFTRRTNCSLREWAPSLIIWRHPSSRFGERGEAIRPC